MMYKYKKWFLLFTAFLILILLSGMAVNIIVDPLEIFGLNLLNMNGYGMAKNIRLTKIAYLDKNYKQFNSYIIGGSKAGSLIPDVVEIYKRLKVL